MKRLAALMLCLACVGCGPPKFKATGSMDALKAIADVDPGSTLEENKKLQEDCQLVAIDGDMANFDGAGAWDRMTKLNGMTAEQIRARAAELRQAHPGIQETLKAAEAKRLADLNETFRKLDQMQHAFEEMDKAMRRDQAR